MNNPNIICHSTSPSISSKDIVDLDKSYFDNVEVVLMNPPYVSGINSVERKNSFFKRIEILRGSKPKTQIGQIGLEAPFIELVNMLTNYNTVIACIIPISYLTARGKEAIEFRKFLIEEFGLQLIFTYPSIGLFESVTKKTCIVVGQKSKKLRAIKVISAFSPLNDINMNEFECKLKSSVATEEFQELTKGIDIKQVNNDILKSNINFGWRDLNSIGNEGILILDNDFKNNDKLLFVKNIDNNKLSSKRGWAGNSGGSDLIFIKKDNPIVKNPKIKTIESVRAVQNFNFPVINKGDNYTIDIDKSDANEVETIIKSYIALPKKTGKQVKKEKNYEELKSILEKDSKYSISGYKLLLPRLTRGIGKTFYSDIQMIISTNFVCYYSKEMTDIKIYTSWTSTIFYQLICEINCKDQEGARKMEINDFNETLFPNISLLSDDDKTEILSNFNNIKFKDLRNPSVSDTDEIWAKILFSDPEDMISKSLTALQLLANTRNPISKKKDR